MNEVSKMSAQMTCADSPNATSSQALEFGATHCDKLVGLMIDPSGLAPAPANLSPKLAKELGLLTSGTYGQPSSISSRSASLRLYLVSKLSQRLNTLGSTLYKLTWKEQATPLGLRVSLLRASAHRTSGHAYTGWVTPNTRDWKDTPGQTTLSKNPDGSKRTRVDQTPRQAAQWVGFGKMRSGLSSRKGSSGLFNPALSRWLIGLPTTWDDAAPTVMRYVDPSQRNLSKQVCGACHE